MTYAQMVSEVASKAEVSRGDVAVMIKALREVVLSEVKAGNKVALPEFVTFEGVDKAERIGRNPATGASMIIPAHKEIKAKFPKKVKDAING